MKGLADDKIGQAVLRTLKEVEMLLVGQLHCLLLKEVAPRKHNRLVPDHQCGPGRWVSTGMASHQEVKKGLWKEVDGGAGSLSGSVREVCGEVLPSVCGSGPLLRKLELHYEEATGSQE